MSLILGKRGSANHSLLPLILGEGGSANHSLMSLILRQNTRDQGFTTANVFNFTKSITFVQDIKHCFRKKVDMIMRLRVV